MKILSKLFTKIESLSSVKNLEKVLVRSEEQKRFQELEGIIYHLGAKVEDLSTAILIIQEKLIANQLTFEEVLHALDNPNISLEFPEDSELVDCQDEDYVKHYGSRTLKKSELN